MRCSGGSWHNVEKPGHPHDLRMLVEFKRREDGSQDLKAFETYIRETPGGDFVFAHEGPANAEDGSWRF